MSRRGGLFNRARRYLSSEGKVKVEKWRSATSTQPEGPALPAPPADIRLAAVADPAALITITPYGGRTVQQGDRMDIFDSKGKRVGTMARKRDRTPFRSGASPLTGWDPS